jgi:hypothetical protein
MCAYRDTHKEEVESFPFLAQAFHKKEKNKNSAKKNLFEKSCHF